MKWLKEEILPLEEKGNCATCGYWASINCNHSGKELGICWRHSDTEMTGGNGSMPDMVHTIETDYCTLYDSEEDTADKVVIEDNDTELVNKGFV